VISGRERPILKKGILPDACRSLKISTLTLRSGESNGNINHERSFVTELFHTVV